MKKHVTLAGAALALITCAALVGASPALAQGGKSQQAKGNFMSFDSEANTITVREGGQDVTYKVKPEGSVLTRTTVKINGKPSYVKDLPEGAHVIVYWRPDEQEPDRRFARSIDAPRVSPEQLEEEEED